LIICLFIMEYRKRDVTCINCGYTGHTSRNCNYPITSFGVIAFKLHFGKLYFLMIQRKDSLCYTEFIRGKYDIKNIGYISKLFSYMTQEEKNRILEEEFDTLWKKLWINNTNNLKKEYGISRGKFNKLIAGYKIKSKETILHISANYFVENTESIDEQEWEFPKGRRKLNETDFMCATREFEEETTINQRFIQFLDINKQYEEIFIGKNKLRYRNVFYLGGYTRGNIRESFFDNQNADQIKEIKDVKWMSYDDVTNKLQGNIEKLELFRRVYNQLRKNKSLVA
jgi:ADP-ribose pyrophosphatase YjhB (NUDIX family)